MRLIQILALIVCFLTIRYTLNAIPSAYGFTMEGGNYRIELPDILGERTQTQPPTYVSLKENPTITRGLGPFTFSVSSTLVDFGIITPTDPVTRTTNLIVEKGKVPGYQVFTYENHPLWNEQAQDSIPDTPCDLGSCTEISPQAWVNPLVFGLGYRLDTVQGGASGLGLDNRKSLFLQYASRDASESGRMILSARNNKSTKRNDEARVTYKVNIPASQKEGLYQNVIYYVAVPNY